MATMVQAVRMALHYAEEHLGVTDVFGEDVGPPLGGVFTATQGLRTAWNSPLDERGIIGTAMGIAYAGGKPVCEIPFCDYAKPCGEHGKCKHEADPEAYTCTCDVGYSGRNCTEGLRL